jgi:hypothetical protein
MRFRDISAADDEFVYPAWGQEHQIIPTFAVVPQDGNEVWLWRLCLRGRSASADIQWHWRLTHRIGESAWSSETYL